MQTFRHSRICYQSSFFCVHFWQHFFAKYTLVRVLVSIWPLNWTIRQARPVYLALKEATFCLLAVCGFGTHFAGESSDGDKIKQVTPSSEKMATTVMTLEEGDETHFLARDFADDGIPGVGLGSDKQ